MEEFDGYGLTELTAGTKFPRIGELPYLLTLPAYAFYWFKMEKVGADARHSSPYLPELFTLVASGRIEGLLSDREVAAFENTVAPAYLQTKRWFAAKAARVSPGEDRRFRDPPRRREGALRPCRS